MKVIQFIARIHALRSYYTMIVQTLYKRSVCFWVTMNWVYISSKNMVWNDKKQISYTKIDLPSINTPKVFEVKRKK